MAIGQTSAGRYLRVIYVPDPEPDTVFVITAYQLTGKPLMAYRRHWTAMENVTPALAEVELVLIHPFREGNGRVARILSVLMGLQAGLPALYFDNLSGRRQQQYFAEVQAGLDRNYEPMAKLFTAVIERTFQTHGER